MKYVATYCTLNRETGSNPLWHSCLLLSKTNENNQLEVIEFWSFYGVPTTAPENSWLHTLKVYLKVDVDFNGNHGMLRIEEFRRLCLGRGLHASNFELTKERFELLQKTGKTMLADQDAAIREVVESQQLAGKTAKIRLYPQEHRSLLIYELEKIKAEQKGQPPRLKPFEFKISFGFSGPSLATSSTCKSQIIELMSVVLSKEQIARLTEDGKHPTVPRFSGFMEPIYLHATGPFRIHTKPSGEQVHYHDNDDLPRLKLIWTLAPQYIDGLSEDTYNLFYIDEDYVDEVKLVIGRLIQLEQLCRDAIVPEEYKAYRDALLERIIKCYTAFSILNTNGDAAKKTNDWVRFGFSLFSVPINEEQRSITAKLADAQLLFNFLYMAIVEDWKIIPKAVDPKTPAKGLVFTRPVANSTFEGDNLEAVAAYFPKKQQMELCRLIGRSYCAPEEKQAEVEVFAAEYLSVGERQQLSM